MRIDEYYAYYEPLFFDKTMTGTEEKLVAKRPEDALIALQSLVKDILKEAEELIKRRKPMRVDAYASIVKELNQKWNGLVARFEKRGLPSPIARDVLIGAWRKAIEFNQAYVASGYERYCWWRGYLLAGCSLS